MERLKNEFLSQLNDCLGEHLEKDSILKEYEVHLDELLLELLDLKDESEIRDQIYTRLGTPEEIADMWEDELSVTPSRMKWLFIAVNIFLFGGELFLL